MDTLATLAMKGMRNNVGNHIANCYRTSANGWHWWSNTVGRRRTSGRNARRIMAEQRLEFADHLMGWIFDPNHHCKYCDEES
jgi:hypothetical protein